VTAIIAYRAPQATYLACDGVVVTGRGDNIEHASYGPKWRALPNGWLLATAGLESDCLRLERYVRRLRVVAIVPTSVSTYLRRTRLRCDCILAHAEGGCWVLDDSERTPLEVPAGGWAGIGTAAGEVLAAVRTILRGQDIITWGGWVQAAIESMNVVSEWNKSIGPPYNTTKVEHSRNDQVS
jgi:hypothetical protein